MSVISKEEKLFPSEKRLFRGLTKDANHVGKMFRIVLIEHWLCPKPFVYVSLFNSYRYVIRYGLLQPLQLRELEHTQVK